MTSAACDVLVLGAFHPEIAPLGAILGGDALRSSVRVAGLDVSARATGIGVSMAAAGAAMHLAELRPRAVVLVGTCGAYADAASLGIGAVAVPSWVRLTAPCIVDGVAEVPEPMPVLQRAHDAIVQALLDAGGRPGDVASTLGVTVDDGAALRLARVTRAAAEHLEAHGVATACAARGVPFAAALGVANAVGARARDEWRMHHRAAAAAAIDVVVRWLRAGAPGAGATQLAPTRERND